MQEKQDFISKEEDRIFDDKNLAHAVRKKLKDGSSHEEIISSVVGFATEVSQEAWSRGRQDLLEHYNQEDSQLLKSFKRIHEEHGIEVTPMRFVEFSLNFLEANIGDIKELLEDE